MELPHGVLVKSFRGPARLAELNANLLRDAFTGFLRASLMGESIVEGVVVYGAGTPVLAFTSDAKTDHPDGEQKAVAAVMAAEDAVIELFALNAGQFRLVVDFGKEFMLRPPTRAAPPRVEPPRYEAPRAEAPRPLPVQRPRVESKPRSFPEVRGRFIKAESPESLQSYIDTRNGETGHAVFIRPDDGQEYHLLFLRGKVVAAYSAKDGGSALLGGLLPAGGMVEFYFVDESLVNSILKMYPHVALAYEKPQEPAREPVKEPVKEPVQEPVREPAKEPAREPRPMQVQRPEPTARSEPTTVHGPATRPPADKPKPMMTHRQDDVPRKGIGVPTKSLFDKGEPPQPGESMGANGAVGGSSGPGNGLNSSNSLGMSGGMGTSGGMGMPAPEAKSTGALKGEVDDDEDFVRKVEKEFVGNVDDLLKRLELSHLKVVPDKKKRP